MNNLITIAGEKLPLPAPRSKGAEELFQRLERLPQWLPRGVVPAQFVMAVTAEANRVPRDVDAGSIVAAAFNCAVVGLLPGPQLGHAHFVPFKQKGGARVCQLIIGYKGYLHLAYGCGFLKAVQPEVVLRGEEFERWNIASGAQLLHKMAIDRELVWSNVIGSYCIWQSTTGGGDVSVVGRKELEMLKRRGNVWNDNPIAMSKKTAILRARKEWKVTGQMADATYLDDLAERGEPQPLLRGDEPEDEPTPSLTEFDAKPQAEPSADPDLTANFAAKLRAGKDVEEMWAEIEADPAFERLSEEARVELAKERDKILGKRSRTL
jgi:phage RecT family recombinase